MDLTKKLEEVSLNSERQAFSPSSLTEDEVALVGDLRKAVADVLHPKYDTDYNLYRWIRNASKVRYYLFVI